MVFDFLCTMYIFVVENKTMIMMMIYCFL